MNDEFKMLIHMLEALRLEIRALTASTVEASLRQDSQVKEVLMQWRKADEEAALVAQSLYL